MFHLSLQKVTQNYTFCSSSACLLKGIKINYLFDLINQQIEANVNYLSQTTQQVIDYQEDLSDCLSKAEALARVALDSNFLNCSDEIKHNFLWALCDIIDNSKMINEEILDLLFECKVPKIDLIK